MAISRRDFVHSALLGAASLSVPGSAKADTAPAQGSGKAKLPVIISAANGFKYLDEAYTLLSGGGDTLDAALKVVQGPEDDPNDELGSGHADQSPSARHPGRPVHSSFRYRLHA